MDSTAREGKSSFVSSFLILFGTLVGALEFVGIEVVLTGCCYASRGGLFVLIDLGGESFFLTAT
jgi:hypothetical protein